MSRPHSPTQTWAGPIVLTAVVNMCSLAYLKYNSLKRVLWSGQKTPKSLQARKWSLFTSTLKSNLSLSFPLYPSLFFPLSLPPFPLYSLLLLTFSLSFPPLPSFLSLFLSIPSSFSPSLSFSLPLYPSLSLTFSPSPLTFSLFLPFSFSFPFSLSPYLSIPPSLSLSFLPLSLFLFILPSFSFSLFPL